METKGFRFGRGLTQGSFHSYEVCQWSRRQAQIRGAGGSGGEPRGARAPRDGPYSKHSCKARRHSLAYDCGVTELQRPVITSCACKQRAISAVHHSANRKRHGSDTGGRKGKGAMDGTDVKGWTGILAKTGTGVGRADVCVFMTGVRGCCSRSKWQQCGNTLPGTWLDGSTRNIPLAQGRPFKRQGNRAKGYHFDSTKGYPGEGPTQANQGRGGKGMEVISVNVTSMGSLWKFLDRCQPTASIILVQETHTKDQNGEGQENPANKARQKAMQMGYRALLTSAYDTGRGGTRGGLITLWRPDYEVIGMAQVWEGHANGILVKLAKVGCIAIFNVYGCPEGNQEFNRRLLSKVAQQATAWGKPFLIGGDFNMLPEEVQGMLQEQAIPAQVNAPAGATCITTKACRTIDMFVVSHRLSIVGVSPAKTKHSGGVRTHTPVAVFVRTQQGKVQVTVHKRPSACKDGPTEQPWASYEYTEAQEKIKKLMEELGLTGAGIRLTKYPTERWMKMLEEAYEAWHNRMAEEMMHIYATKDGPQKKLKFQSCCLGDLVGGSIRAGRITPSTALGYMKDRIRELMAAKEAGTTRQVTGELLRRWVKPGKLKDLKHHLQGQGNQEHGKELDSFVEAVNKWAEHGEESSSYDELEILHKGLSTAYDQEVKTEHKMQATEWQEYVEEALTRKVSAGFRLAHIAELEDTPKVMGKEGFSTGLQQVLESEAKKWTELWEAKGEDKDFEQELLRQEVRMMPPLRAEEIRAAARSFKEHTANIEGCAPRQVGQLSSGCLEALANMFYCCECLGIYPQVLEQKLVKLLVKKDGSTRPIMLFRTLYRIHAKARGEVVRRWEAKEAAGSSYNNSPNRRIGDVVYRQAVRNAIAAAEGRHVVEVCWDFKKAFEHVQRPLLWQKAQAQGYPMALLRMSLRSYGWDRRILTEHNVVSGTIKARRGIAAGSAFAIYELKAYCREFTMITHGLPGATLSLHVDDTIIRVEGPTREEVLEVLERVASRAQKELQVIQMPLAMDKEAVIASDDKLRVEALRCLGSKVSSTATRGHVVKLGVDYNISQQLGPVFGRKRMRFTVFRKKANKLKKILRKRAYGRVMQAGLLAGVMYGAEVTDYTQQEIEELRKEALRSERMHVPGVPNSVKWMLVGARKDPETRIRMAPILAYHREVWQLSIAKEGWAQPDDGLTAREVVKFWTLVEQEIRGLQNAEEGPKGAQAAVQALAKGLLHFGVHLPTPIDLEGELRYGLDVTSGGRVKQALLEEADERLAKQVSEWVIRQGLATDQEKFELTNNGLQWKPLRQKANTMAAGHRRVLAGIVAGQLRCGEETRQWGKKGKEQEDIRPQICPICQKEEDSYKHRVTSCTLATQLREEEAKGNQQIDHGSLTALNRRGLWAKERKWLPIAMEQPRFSVNGTVCEVQKGTAFFAAEDGPLYLDGSGFYGGTEVAVAAGAVVQKTKTGWKEAVMGVSDLGSQGAATGEVLAAHIAVEHSDNGQHTFVVDCAAVIHGWEHRYVRPRFQAVPAGLWRQIAGIERGKERPPPEFVKTKAHRVQAVAEAEGDGDNYHGNEKADLAAKAAAEAYGPPQTFVGPALARWKLAKRSIGLLTKTILEGFKRAERHAEQVTRVRRAVRTVSVPHTPVWEGRSRSFRCTACGIAGANLHVLQKCKGRSGAALAVFNAASRAGHVLWEGRLTGGHRHGQAALFCAKCGSTATVRAVNLKDRCPQVPKGASQRRLLTMLAKGEYAYEKGTMVTGLRPTEMTPNTVKEMWESARVYRCRAAQEGLGTAHQGGTMQDAVSDGREGSLEQVCGADEEGVGGACVGAFEEGFSLDEMEAFFGPLDH